VSNTEKNYETVVYRGEEALRASLEVFYGAKSIFCAVSDKKAPSLGVKVEPYRQAYLGMIKRGVKVRAITEITRENIEYCKDLIGLGIVSELRHMDGVRGNFAVTDNEYIASSNLTEASPSLQIIRSNDPEIKSQNLFVFETLWSRATPAANRMMELEQGMEVEETTLVTDFAELYRLGSRAIEELKDEVLIVLASEKTISRNLKMFEKISELQKERGFKIRVLVNSKSDQPPPSAALTVLHQAEWRSLEWSGQLTIMVFDRRRMFITQYVDLFGSTLQEAVMSNIYTTNKQMIEGIASFYDALWSESWLRSKEERSRIQAQLMQDILAHDLRNHSQAARLNAELLLTELRKNGQKNSSDMESMITSILDSIDRSTLLVDRATKLGKIISEGGNATLFSTSLGQAISNAFDIVAKSQGKNNKRLDVKLTNSLEKSGPSSAAGNQISDLNSVYVLADGLLELVFSNLFSNAMKYSSSATAGGISHGASQVVSLELRIEEVTESLASPGKESEQNKKQERRRPRSAPSFYRISIIDQGDGIPDEYKKELFTRYLKRARGSGLGLSIVHALVVERYRGKIRVRNRVEGDYKQGTVFEILLPKSFPLNG
jgi:two-component system sensor histidine kinase VicK